MARISFARTTRLLLAFFLIFLLSPFQPSRAIQAAAPGDCVEGFCVYRLFLYHPTSVDLSISGLEISQAVQTPANSIPQVLGRKTIVRISARATGVEGIPAPLAKIRLTATRGGVTLPGSIETGAAVVSTNPQRSSYASTINLALPAAWTSGTIVLTATVDPDGVVAELAEGNNSFSQQITFHSLPNLQVRIVPVRYTHTRNGQTYPAPTQDRISTKIKYMYPVADVSITWDPVLEFTGDLTYRDPSGSFPYWSQLLDAVAARKSGDPAIAFYGLVPADWFSSGVVGVGYVGYRAAVGLNYWDATGTAAHEIGHNFGLWHAPCGGPSGVDPNYPYPGAQIGEYGINVYTNQLIPNTRVDLMSYCDNEWISDYHYQKLYNSQAVYADGIQALSSSTGPALLLRAVVTGTGGVTLSPIYRVSDPADPPVSDSPFHVRLLTAGGTLLAEQPVRAYAVADLPVAETHLLSRVALPDGVVVARVQLWREDELLVEQALAGGLVAQAHPVAVVQGGRLAWGSAGPVLVRYSLDSGLTWKTLALDVTENSLNLDPVLKDALFEVIPALPR